MKKGIKDISRNVRNINRFFYNQFQNLKTTHHIVSGFIIVMSGQSALSSPTGNHPHPNGGVRGGTIRLLPVDSKAEATRSRLLSS